MLLILCSCSISISDRQINEPIDVNPLNDTEDEDQLSYFSEEEIFDFPLLRSDWSKEQMEKAGLSKDTLREDETYYFDDNVRYTYFDWWPESTTPCSVDIFGHYTGPRGIEVGDDFKEVLSLFPNEKDWKTSEFGEFYGKIYETEEKEPFGSITVINNGEIWLTLSPAGYGPFLRVFFTDDKVTHYTFYLNTPN